MNSNLLEALQNREQEVDSKIKKIVRTEIPDYNRFIEKTKNVKLILLVLIPIIIVLAIYYYFTNQIMEFNGGIVSLIFFIYFYLTLLRLINLVNEKLFIDRIKRLL